jgi:hypothetical protein
MIDYRLSTGDVVRMCTAPALVERLSILHDGKWLQQDAPVTCCQLEASIKSVWRRVRNFAISQFLNFL